MKKENIIKRLMPELQKLFEQKDLFVEDDSFNDENRLKFKESKIVFGYMDSTKCLAIRFTDEKFEDWFYRTFQGDVIKFPKLSYKIKRGDSVSCKFDYELISKALEICKCFNDSVKLEIKTNYPITITASNEIYGDVVFIIAPRVDNN